MSTRATYRIDGHTFYIHYDGYPQGAASYFASAARFDNRRGGCAETFLRANDLAEFTTSHEVHGDTEYRYDYDSRNDHLVAHKSYGSWDAREWRVIFSGGLAEFLNAHDESKEERWGNFFGRVLPLASAVEIAHEKFKAFAFQMEHGWTGNAGSVLDDIKRGLGSISPASVLGAEWDLANQKVNAAFAAVR